MKFTLSAVLLLLFTLTYVIGQNIIRKNRQIRFDFITKDSVNLHLNDDFYIIEDNCSTITRYAHLNMQKRIFTGAFKDVSRSNPTAIVTEGSYNADGLKDGAFTCYYANGQLQAKGDFKNGEYSEKWNVYYNNGKPRLIFIAKDGVITITDVWDAPGKKIIDNGKGNYQVVTGDVLLWKGKLLKGRPIGDWKLTNSNISDGPEMMSETFKDGVFKKGTAPSGEYTDASRLVLVPTDMLPFTRAERLYVSPLACGAIAPPKIVNAYYKSGLSDFSHEIYTKIGSVVVTGTCNCSFDITGEVDEYGGIVKLIIQPGTDNAYYARKIMNCLDGLPALVPATVDGKIVRQKIKFTFVFVPGSVKFSYNFLPIEVK